jgi:DNA recombination-dependent growth factor C
LEFLTKAIRQEEEMKGMQIGKEIIKLSLFVDNIILHIQDPKNSTKKTRYHKQLQQSGSIQNQFTKN